MNHRLAAMTGAFLVGAVGVAGAQTRYVLTDLGVPPGFMMSWARGVNDAGVVVGDAYDGPTNTRHAFRWESGSAIDLGALPGGRSCFGDAINDFGEVVGRSDTSDGHHSWHHGYFLGAGPMVPLLTLPERGTRANDLNDLGVTVGTGLFDFFLPSEPVMWIDPATPVRLGTLMPDGGGEALGINDAGWVVGKASTFDGLGVWDHGFVWDGLTMTDLGTFGGPTGFSAANDINSSNKAVGYAENRPAAQSRAFVYHAGTMVDLGALHGYPNSEARAINDAGRIVGWSNSTDLFSHAVMWEGGAIHDLNDLVLPVTHGWKLVSAEDISDTGYIVGFGYPPGGSNVHAVLLTPLATRNIQRVSIPPRHFP